MEYFESLDDKKKLDALKKIWKTTELSVKRPV